MRVELFLEVRGRESFLCRGRARRDGRFQMSVQIPEAARGAAMVLKVIEQRPPLSADEALARRWRVVTRARSGPLDPQEPVAFGDVMVRYWSPRPGVPWRRVRPEPWLEEIRPAVEVTAAQEHRRRWTRVLHQQPWLAGAARMHDALDALTPPDDPLSWMLAHLGLTRWRVAQDGAWRWSSWDGAQVDVAPDGVTATHIYVPELGERLARDGVSEEAWRTAEAMLSSRLLSDAVFDGLVRSTHWRLEGLAIAARRSLRQSPLRGLVEPHIRDVAQVNLEIEDWLEDRSWIGQLLYVTAREDRPVGVAPWDASMVVAPRGPGDQRGVMAALVWSAISEAIDSYWRRHRDELSSTAHELATLAEELTRVWPTSQPFDGTDTSEESLDRWSTWLKKLIFVACFQTSWDRDMVSRVLRWQSRETNLSTDDLRLAAHRHYLGHLVHGTEVPALIDNGLGEVLPELVHAIRGISDGLSCDGWDVQRLGYRARL